MYRCDNSRCVYFDCGKIGSCSNFTNITMCPISIIKEKKIKPQCKTCKNYKPVESDLDITRKNFDNLSNTRFDSFSKENVITLYEHIEELERELKRLQNGK